MINIMYNESGKLIIGGLAMKNKTFLFLALLVILIPTGIIFARNLMLSPLDPPLDLDIPSVAEPTENEEVAEAPSSPSNDDKRTCGNKGKTKLFQIGVASPVETSHPGADAVRLVVVDYDQVTAGILALPADMWVNTPDDLVEHLGDLAPLNLIYLTAYETFPGSPHGKVLTRKATQILAQTIVDEFDFVPDKYININGDAFIELVDTLGGITITLTEEIDATAENYGIFPAVEQVLNGQRTLDFVRILYPNGIGPDYFGRFDRQNLVLHALLYAVLHPDNWGSIPDLVKDARKMVVTDLSVDQARDLACMVEEVDGDADLLVVTPDMVVFDDQGRMIPDIEAIKELIKELEGE
jgi:LCP family protein required for cell wall assembly